MVNLLDTREVGDTIRFESELYSSLPFNENESLTDADTIEITIEKRDGTKVVDSQSMTEHAEGQYYFEWDTSGLEATDYKVTVSASTSNASETDCGFIRLEEC